jgi:hypothetical protein
VTAFPSEDLATVLAAASEHAVSLRLQAAQQSAYGRDDTAWKLRAGADAIAQAISALEPYCAQED